MRRSVLLAAAIVILGGVLFSIRIVTATQYPELLLSQGIEEMGRGEYERALERFKMAALCLLMYLISVFFACDGFNVTIYNYLESP